jgi:hypothetical protein
LKYPLRSWEDYNIKIKGAHFGLHIFKESEKKRNTLLVDLLLIIPCTYTFLQKCTKYMPKHISYNPEEKPVPWRAIAPRTFRILPTIKVKPGSYTRENKNEFEPS